MPRFPQKQLAVDAATWIGDFAAFAGRIIVRGGNMRIGITTAALAFAVALAAMALPARGALAQSGPAASSSPAATELSSQRRATRRPPTRLRIHPLPDASGYGVYPRYNPGPNAVRDCTAFYVQEFRPSGTVIVPRLNCHWRRG